MNDSPDSSAARRCLPATTSIPSASSPEIRKKAPAQAQFVTVIPDRSGRTTATMPAVATAPKVKFQKLRASAGMSERNR